MNRRPSGEKAPTPRSGRVIGDRGGNVECGRLTVLWARQEHGGRGQGRLHCRVCMTTPSRRASRCSDEKNLPFMHSPCNLKLNGLDSGTNWAASFYSHIHGQYGTACNFECSVSRCSPSHGLIPVSRSCALSTGEDSESYAYGVRAALTDDPTFYVDLIGELTEYASWIPAVEPL